MRQITNAEELREFLNSQKKTPDKTDEARAEYFRAKAEHERAKTRAIIERSKSKGKNKRASVSDRLFIGGAIIYAIELLIYFIVFCVLPK